jgi:hypothetical protein
LEIFLSDFPSVSRELAVAVLEEARAALIAERILLDEDLPRRLAGLLAGQDVSTYKAEDGPACTGSSTFHRDHCGGLVPDPAFAGTTSTHSSR